MEGPDSLAAAEVVAAAESSVAAMEAQLERLQQQEQIHQHEIQHMQQQQLQQRPHQHQQQSQHQHPETQPTTGGSFLSQTPGQEQDPSASADGNAAAAEATYGLGLPTAAQESLLWANEDAQSMDLLQQQLAAVQSIRAEHARKDKTIAALRQEVSALTALSQDAAEDKAKALALQEKCAILEEAQRLRLAELAERADEAALREQENARTIEEMAAHIKSLEKELAAEKKTSHETLSQCQRLDHSLRQLSDLYQKDMAAADQQQAIAKIAAENLDRELRECTADKHEAQEELGRARAELTRSADDRVALHTQASAAETARRILEQEQTRLREQIADQAAQLARVPRLEMEVEQARYEAREVQQLQTRLTELQEQASAQKLAAAEKDKALMDVKEQLTEWQDKAMQAEKLRDAVGGLQGKTDAAVSAAQRHISQNKLLLRRLDEAVEDLSWRRSAAKRAGGAGDQNHPALHMSYSTIEPGGVPGTRVHDISSSGGGEAAATAGLGGPSTIEGVATDEVRGTHWSQYEEMNKLWRVCHGLLADIESLSQQVRVLETRHGRSDLGAEEKTAALRKQLRHAQEEAQTVKAKLSMVSTDVDVFYQFLETLRHQLASTGVVASAVAASSSPSSSPPATSSAAAAATRSARGTPRDCSGAPVTGDPSATLSRSVGAGRASGTDNSSGRQAWLQNAVSAGIAELVSAFTSAERAQAHLRTQVDLAQQDVERLQTELHEQSSAHAANMHARDLLHSQQLSELRSALDQQATRAVEQVNTARQSAEHMRGHTQQELASAVVDAQAKLEERTSQITNLSHEASRLRTLLADTSAQRDACRAELVNAKSCCKMLARAYVPMWQQVYMLVWQKRLADRMAHRLWLNGRGLAHVVDKLQRTGFAVGGAGGLGDSLSPGYRAGRDLPVSGSAMSGPSLAPPPLLRAWPGSEGASLSEGINGDVGTALSTKAHTVRPAMRIVALAVLVSVRLWALLRNPNKNVAGSRRHRWAGHRGSGSLGSHTTARTLHFEDDGAALSMVNGGEVLDVQQNTNELAAMEAEGQGGATYHHHAGSSTARCVPLAFAPESILEEDPELPNVLALEALPFVDGIERILSALVRDSARDDILLARQPMVGGGLGGRASRFLEVPSHSLLAHVASGTALHRRRLVARGLLPTAPAAPATQCQIGAMSSASQRPNLGRPPKRMEWWTAAHWSDWTGRSAAAAVSSWAELSLTLSSVSSDAPSSSQPLLYRFGSAISQSRSPPQRQSGRMPVSSAAGVRAANGNGNSNNSSGGGSSSGANSNSSGRRSGALNRASPLHEVPTAASSSSTWSSAEVQDLISAHASTLAAHKRDRELLRQADSALQKQSALMEEHTERMRVLEETVASMPSERSLQELQRAGGAVAAELQAERQARNQLVNQLAAAQSNAVTAQRAAQTMSLSKSTAEREVDQLVRMLQEAEQGKDAIREEAERRVVAHRRQCEEQVMRTEAQAREARAQVYALTHQLNDAATHV